MAIDRSKFLAKFTDEAREHCAKLTDGLLSLENSMQADNANPAASDSIICTNIDLEAINSLFRSAHTIKGSARMMKLTSIGELAHGMEDLLDSVRNGKVRLSHQFFELLLKSVDVLLTMLDSVASTNGSPPAPADLCEALKKAAAADIPENLEDTASKSEEGVKQQSIKKSEESLEGKELIKEIELLKDKEGVKSAAPFKEIDSKTDTKENGHNLKDNQVLPINQQLQEEPKKTQRQATHQTQYLHINTTKLDDLIRLMGEIISDHNRFKKDVKILQESARIATHAITAVNSLIDKHTISLDEIRRATENSMAMQITLQQAARAIADAVLMQSHLMGELQDTTLKLSMMPLSTVFDPLRRAVRDLAKESGKDVVFAVSGGETELDRKIAERIGDSLLHMIRNSLDHGIENPEERIASGKSPKGTINLSAFYDSGGVTIALKDDGRGLNIERIKAKALAKNLFDAETISMMSRTEILNLIFLPGFSTSPIITDLSGRGVGMDVVRKNIVDELKGTIAMESSEGAGTTFMLRLPLNLAVFPLCMVSSSGQIFALPATSIAELCAVTVDQLIEIIGKKAIKLREEIIPVEYLSSILQLNFKEDSVSSISVVVVKEGADKLGLMVDEIIGREEMVVKPLPTHLSNLRIVTGGTIGRGDSIVNVLHVPEIMRLASRTSASRVVADKLGADKYGSDNLTGQAAQSATILVVDDSINTREIEKSILEAYGYIVETAEDGEDALEKINGKLYDLVITDVEMPRLDGFSLTAKLRSDSRYSTLPIIIVTSLEKESDKKRGIKAGADAYIVKRAFDQSNLLDTVKSLIG